MTCLQVETLSPQKDVCYDIIVALSMERIKMCHSGAFTMDCKNERH
jgi:hypothetical protein